MSKCSKWAPLSNGSNTVSFPKKLLEYLPDPIRIFIISVAVALQCDIGLVLGSFLGTLSAVANGRVTVQAQPTHKPTKLEAAQLYIILCAGTGEAKSTSIEFCSKPLVEYIFLSTSADIYMDAVASSRMMEADANIISSIFQPGGDPCEAIRNKRHAEADLDQYRAHLRTTIISDFTPEGLVRELVPTHGYGIVITDEPDALAVLSGNLYSKNGFVNLDVITKGFSNGRLSVTRSKGRINLPKVALSIVIGAQPDIFYKCIGKLTKRGIAERFIYILPPDHSGTRVPYTDEVPDAVYKNYSDTIRRLIHEIIEQDGEKTIKFSAEAEAAFETFFIKIEARRKSGADLSDGNILGWSERIKPTATRIAGLFALFLGEDTVSLECWTAAEQITVEYLIPCARAALCDNLLSSPARSLIPYLIGRESITQAELNRRVHLIKDFKIHPKHFEPALKELEKYGLIRIVKSPKTATRGRNPGPVIYIHPDIEQVK